MVLRSNIVVCYVNKKIGGAYNEISPSGIKAALKEKNSPSQDGEYT